VVEYGTAGKKATKCMRHGTLLDAVLDNEFKSNTCGISVSRQVEQVCLRLNGWNLKPTDLLLPAPCETTPPERTNRVDFVRTVCAQFGSPG